MIAFIPLASLLSLVSAIPKDYAKLHHPFGMPVAGTQVGSSVRQEGSDQSLPEGISSQEGRVPGTIDEHLRLGGEDDTGHFRKFWEILMKAVPAETEWSLQEAADAGSPSEADLSIGEEKLILPDIKIIKYELPPLPEENLPELPPLPDMKFPDFKIVKYELPPFPEVAPVELPPLPEVNLPDFKITKYELPPFPEINLLPVPEIKPVEFPDIKIFKYELPSLPEIEPLDLPPLPDIELPDIKVVKYELPPFPELKPMDIPRLPDLKMPDIKVIKYELPPLPEPKNFEFPSFNKLFPEVNVTTVQLEDNPPRSKQEFKLQAAEGHSRSGNFNEPVLLETPSSGEKDTDSADVKVQVTASASLDQGIADNPKTELVVAGVRPPSTEVESMSSDLMRQVPESLYLSDQGLVSVPFYSLNPFHGQLFLQSQPVAPGILGTFWTNANWVQRQQMTLPPYDVPEVTSFEWIPRTTFPEHEVIW